MSELHNAIYNSTNVPVEICNIIALYAIEHIKQVYINGSMYYQYNNTLMLKSPTVTIGIIDNVPRKIALNNSNLLLINLTTNELIRMIKINLEILQMGYSNGLVCFTSDSCVIYTVGQSLKLRASMKIETNYYRLVYVDDKYIIIRTSNSKCLEIYDPSLKLIHTIIAHDIVGNIALVNNVLSYEIYPRPGWTPIKF